MQRAQPRQVSTEEIVRTQIAQRRMQENDVEFIAEEFLELSIEGNTFSHVSSTLLFCRSANCIFFVVCVRKKNISRHKICILMQLLLVIDALYI